MGAKADSVKSEESVAAEQALMQMMTGAWVTQAVATAAKLVMTGGQERTAGEYESLLRRGGFRLEKIVPTAGPSSVIEGRPA